MIDDNNKRHKYNTIHSYLDAYVEHKMKLVQVVGEKLGGKKELCTIRHG
jgi:hypothetical protein